MKKRFNLLSMLFLAGIVLFSSCKKDEEPEEQQPVVSGSKLAYIVNYGSFSGAKGEISVYNTETKAITNNAYMGANSIEFNSNIQHMALFNDKLYVMSNNGDKIDVIDPKTMKQTTNPTSTNIIKPRYFVANGTTAYVSCWENADWSEMADTYIAKVNLTDMSVTKIPMPGGPEGLAIANGKLYAALNFKDSIATINLTNDQVSYIATPAVPSYFLKDNSNNLYVSLVSTYSDPSTNSGLGYINTTTDQLTNYPLENVSDSYVSIMAFNNDKSKIYVIAASYDANWVKVGSIKTFNTTSKTFETTPFVSDLTGVNGIAVNPENDDVYVLLSPSASQSGSVKIYSKDKVLKDEKVTGIAPQAVVFYNR